MKPKANRQGDLKKSNGFDRCQTPAYALDPLLPHLRNDWIIWEPAAGEGNIVNALKAHGHGVIGTDILEGKNFFEWVPARWNCVVTNPPYSIKYEWLEHCYDLGKPFALLLPVETLGAATAQRLFDKHGFEIMFLNRRVNFKMPNKGYAGSAAQFPVAWFTYGLGIGSQVTFSKITARDDSQLSLLGHYVPIAIGDDARGSPKMAMLHMVNA